MTQRPPVARRARCGLDSKTTEVALPIPRLQIKVIDGVKGVWVPLHPLAEYRRG